MGFTEQMALGNDMLKIYADWLDVQQAYIRFLQDCMNFYERLVPN